MINSKVKWLDLRPKIFTREKTTKCFCGLENHNYTCKVIGQVEKEDRSIITN